MSEMITGTSLLTLGVEVAGAALSRLFEEAGAPIDTRLLHKTGALSACSLLSDWHRAIKQMKHSSSLRSGTPSALAEAKGLLQALNKTPLLSHVVERTQSDLMEQARQALRLAATTSASHHGINAAQSIEKAVDNAYQLLSDAQQKVVNQAVAESLEEMGYQVERHQSRQVTALWATKGAQGIAVVTDRDGSVQMDMCGFEGQKCRLERNFLLQKLQERGVQIKINGSTLHGRKEGGKLLTDALHIAKNNNGVTVAQAIAQIAQGNGKGQNLALKQRLNMQASIQQRGGY